MQSDKPFAVASQVGPPLLALSERS